MSNVNMISIDALENFDYSVKETEKIKYGDIVLACENRDNLKYFQVIQGGVFHNRFGKFNHDDMVGKPYGSKVRNSKGEGYLTVISFIPSLWEKSMNRQTQIIFNPDISLIVSLLDLNSDSIVYESGTGSGCLSLNISQCLDFGHLYTFEFNKERAAKLKDVFREIGYSDTITVTNRDVIEEGFVVAEEDLLSPDHKYADCIFIDLPTPWKAISQIKKCLKKGGALVSFSPCIEQIHETVKALNENGFMLPRTFECLFRTFNNYRTIKIKVPKLQTKRKFNEDIPYEEREYNYCNSRADMRGHTGYLLISYNF